MNAEDLAVFKEIAHLNERFTGYPTVSGFEEFTYDPDTPLRGDMIDYAYHQRGCIAYVCELWDLFHELGMERPKRFVDYYNRVGREELERLAQWDKDRNGGRLFPGWRATQHPQLGAVEVGGLDARVGIWNPPTDRLAGICTAQAAAFLRVAALLPRLRLEAPRVQSLGAELNLVTVSVRNLGYLATFGLASSRELPWNESVHVVVEADGCELVSSESRRDVGHLAGWGRGRLGGGLAPHALRSRGSRSCRALRWTVRGCGQLHIRAGNCRVGWVERTLQI
jgi:hypothetical protein